MLALSIAVTALSDLTTVGQSTGTPETPPMGSRLCSMPETATAHGRAARIRQITTAIATNSPRPTIPYRRRSMCQPRFLPPVTPAHKTRKIRTHRRQRRSNRRQQTNRRITPIIISAEQQNSSPPAPSPAANGQAIIQYRQPEHNTNSSASGQSSAPATANQATSGSNSQPAKPSRTELQSELSDIGQILAGIIQALSATTTQPVQTSTTPPVTTTSSPQIAGTGNTPTDSGHGRTGQLAARSGTWPA